MENEPIIKGQRVRIYPASNQIQILNQTMGCCRHIWNETLRQIKDAEKERKEGEKVPVYKIIEQVSAQIPAMKKNPDTEWLNDAISSSLGWVLRHMKEAWKRYFDNLKKGKVQEWKDSYRTWQKKRGREIKQEKIYDMGKPKFKRRGHGGSCSFHQHWDIVYPFPEADKKMPLKELRQKAIEYFVAKSKEEDEQKKAIRNGEIKNPEPTVYKFDPSAVIDMIKTASRNQVCKIGVINMPSPQTKTMQLRGVPVLLHQKIEGELKTCTVERTPSGKYYVSIRTNHPDKLTPSKPEVEEETAVGLHNGIKVFVTDDQAVEIAKTNRMLRNSIQRLEVLQRRFSRKYEKNGKEKSNRWHKSRIQIAKLHERVTEQRNHLLHRVSNAIINNPKYKTICVEDWDKKEMMKDKYFAQAIADVSWERLITYIKYKSEWKGKNVLELDKYTPNAKTCSHCEHVNEWVELHHRVWTCKNCGTEHIREVNCAKNTKRMALQKYFDGTEA